jgi:hypothetical protein
MNKLTNSDVKFLVSRLPKDVKEMMCKSAEPLFVGGGFIRAMISGEKVNDIDVFGSSKESLSLKAASLALSRQGRLYETQNAFTVLSHSRTPIQFITRWVYQTAAELILGFDFTVCQAVIWNTGGSGWDSLCHDDFYSDLAAKRLVYTMPQRNEDAGGSLLRVRKFLSRGYNIQSHSLAGVVARLVKGVKFERFEQFQDEAYLAKIINGLLREVDPNTAIDGIELVDEHEVEN